MPSADTGAATIVAATIPAPDSDSRLTPGGPGYRRMSFALFLAGVATFALLYSTQALLPLISSGFAVSASAASWTVAAATGGLALFVLPMSALSERFGRRTVMTASLVVAVGIGVLVPFAPSLGALVALRFLQGAALAGLPASATAYLAEEVRPKALVTAIGLFVAGNSVGGMSGRVITGWVAQEWGWRVAVGVIGVIAVGCAVAFRLLLPAPRHFTPGSLRPRVLAHTVRDHLANPLLCRLYAIGALFMTVFGGVYTVIGYRLTEAPFSLPRGSSARSSWCTWWAPCPRPRPDGWWAGWADGARCTWPAARRQRACSSPSPARSPRPAGPGPHHGRLLRGPRGRVLGGQQDGHDGACAGLRSLPVRVLHRLQHRQHGRRDGVPRGGWAGTVGVGVLAVFGVVTITVLGSRAARMERRGVVAA